eukprot:TRINITY_DN338_c0_g1_i1.p1 TRINITY_DN338_c0_g1~~TRINITY_DN338_c0_g1_i1.p1  ORF type:complete len:202 (-),score=43.54 TRINITY_DN338_c0_g1_i1:125-730(-)
MNNNNSKKKKKGKKPLQNDDVTNYRFYYRDKIVKKDERNPQALFRETLVDRCCSLLAQLALLQQQGIQQLKSILPLELFVLCLWHIDYNRLLLKWNGKLKRQKKKRHERRKKQRVLRNTVHSTPGIYHHQPLVFDFLNQHGNPYEQLPHLDQYVRFESRMVGFFWWARRELRTVFAVLVVLAAVSSKALWRRCPSWSELFG